MPDAAPLTTSQLSAYFDRIDFAGTPRADLPTLRALHRAHALAIPFEAADVQFARPPGLDPQAAFAKLVTARRGGWCYEQNGLFGRVLESLGFTVTRLSAGVMRQVRGDFAMGSHLALKVTLDGEDWLADVGFGASLIAPMPLAEGRHDTPPVPSELSRTDEGYWRLSIAIGDNPFSYDFRNEPADEALLARRCAWQGSDSESPFVQTLVVQRRLPERHAMLRGKVLTRTGLDGAEVRELADAQDLVAVLREDFGLHLPEAAGLWDAILARHAELFAQPEIPAAPTT